MSAELHFEENENPQEKSNEHEEAKEVVRDTDADKTTADDQRRRPNAVVTGSAFSQLDPKNTTYRISLPSVGLVSFTNKLNNFKKLDVDETDAELKRWREVSEEAVNYYTVGGMYQDRFEDPKSEFKEGIETKEGELQSISSLKFRKTEGELKGELALLKVSKMLGLGDVVSVPLPHSGIWVTIKPPTETDLIDFYNSVFREKIVLGRATYGLTLSNFSVHINNRLFDFILKHVHSVNNQDISKENLKNFILVHDFPILAWGFARSMYPNGYNYQRACTADIEKCKHVVEGVINLDKLLYIDNPSLTAVQKQILSEVRPNKLTLDNYNKFISEHTRVVSSEFTTSNGMKFKLRVPTFIEYVTDGLGWINKINSDVESLIVESGDEAEAKNEMLNQYVKSSILRQFNHFVDYIEIEDNVVTDRDTINLVLQALSAEDSLRIEITDQILKFKADTTLAIVGIPEYKCPNCGQSQSESTDERYESVIPLDVMSIVFLVLTTKISKILAREV